MKRSITHIIITSAFPLILPLAMQAQLNSYMPEIDAYLARMAQKGLVTYHDNIKPLDRKYVMNLLDSLRLKVSKLSNIEKKELAFYLREFYFDRYALKPVMHVVGLDAEKRLRAFSYRDSNFHLAIDPLFFYEYESKNQKIVSRLGAGAQIMGYAGKHFGFQLQFRELNERGNFDSIRNENEAPGIIRKDTATKGILNHNQLRVALNYTFKQGNLVAAYDQLTWGYGESGKIVLSDKAPSFPMIRLNYHPTQWLRFHYMHAWLQSGILDSAKTYSTGNTVFNGERQIYVPKFLATHSLQIIPTKGLDIHLGETITYSDKLDPAYLIPVMFFKGYDNMKFNDNILSGANGQLFAQVSSRNHIPNTHIYSTLLIDEIRISELWNRARSRNYFAYNMGINITDPGLKYLTLFAEYTRVKPFVYRNLIPAQNFTHNNFPLGDWMGNNADRLIIGFRYTPLPRLKLQGRYMFMRKGSAGTVEEQYFSEPQPAFLFGKRYKREIFSFQTQYEIINNGFIRFQYGNENQTTFTVGSNIDQRRVLLGLYFGL